MTDKKLNDSAKTIIDLVLKELASMYCDGWCSEKKLKHGKEAVMRMVKNEILSCSLMDDKFTKVPPTGRYVEFNPPPQAPV